MKIGFLLPSNGLSGGFFVVCEHVRGLRARGHDAEILFLSGHLGIRITGYPGMEGVPTRLLADVRADETFDFAFATWWETAFSLESIRARRYGYFVQGFEDRFYEAPLRTHAVLAEKTLCDPFDFFAVSQALCARIERLSGKPATWIRNAIHFSRYLEQSPLQARKTGTPRILVEGPGGLPLKRVGAAFAALAEFPDIETWYVSSDGYREPGWRIDRYFEKVPMVDMPAIYASCDFLVKLSREESFGLPVLEMFAAGGTAVVSAFEGHDEWIKDGGNALVVPIDDQSAATTAIGRLVDSIRGDRTLFERLRSGARTTCESFSWDRSTDALETELKRILEGDPPTQRLEMIGGLRGAYTDLQESVGALGRATEKARQLEVMLEGRDRQIERLKGEISQRDYLLSHKDQLVMAKDALVVEKDSLIQQLQAQAGEAQALRSSASYRFGRALTWPARRVRDWMGQSRYNRLIS